MLHALLFAVSVLAGTTLPVVPLPGHVTPVAGSYTVPKTVTISAATKDERNVADFAVAFLRTRGISAGVTASTTNADVQLRELRQYDRNLGTEGYRLRVDSHGIAIEANGGAGLFYGLQTLEQLFPQTASGNTLHDVSIVDRPAFRWRGIMLDVSRHFYDVSTVERFIDLAAHYKLNTFHWHLSDDQGWRVEIKRYPRLTGFGSCRNGTEVGHNPLNIHPERYCGFYTQQQIREVVAYAAKRYVTIVPEIDMPGHSTAAIASYPWLGCTGKQLQVSMRWGNSYAICPTERAITFEENVLSELMQLFPSRYIHAGGDEVVFSQWRDSAFVNGLMRRLHLQTYAQVQAYFERRIEQFVESKGRRMVGWDEVLKGGISPNAVIMCWHTGGCGAQAAAHGNEAVMVPDGPLYLDAYQGDRNDEPEAIGSLSTLQMVYAYDPLAGVPAAQRQHILGVQGNIWTEWIGSTPHLFYMALPRELALSEIAWAPPASKDWDSFVARTGPQYLWLENNAYNFRIPNPSFALSGGALQFANVSSSLRTVSAKTRAADVTVEISEAVPNAAVYYTTDGTMPTAHSMRYQRPLRLHLRPRERVDVMAAAILPGGRVSTPSELVLTRR